MSKKTLKLKREDVSDLKPKKVKPFNREKFIRMAKELQNAIKREEEKYGPIDSHPRFS